MSRVKELIEEYISDMYDGDKEIMIFDNPSYDSAFLGISNDDRAIYDYDLMVEYLIIEENMSMLEAIEFIDYNSSFYYPNNERYPIILYNIIE